MQPCLEYLANPVDHTELETQDALAALRVCIEARMVLMSVLSRNDPASLPAKTAGYAYISKFGPTCRYQHLPPEYGAPVNLPCSCCKGTAALANQRQRTNTQARLKARQSTDQPWESVEIMG